MDNLNQIDNTEVTAQINLDDAKNAQIMAVVSIVITFCTCCYGGLFAIIFGVLALKKAKKSILEFEANSERYTEKSFNQAKSAKTLSLIGIIIGILSILYFIIALIFGFASALTDIASKGY